MRELAAMPPAAATVLVTGATGYVGGRLVPRLLEEGYRVRVLVRGGADRLHGRAWASDVEIFDGDTLVPASLVDALEGVDAAYYLIHSMGVSDEFGERDRRSARNFGVVAAISGVRRIIYLGGLGDSRTNLSKHLRSRQETGNVLRLSGVPVTEFRAGMIVGSGSLSFEMLRHLTERLPIMIGPHWVSTQCQPIAIRNVLQYLVAALTVPESAGQIVEIGGADVVTYADMIKIYARERNLRRILVSVRAPSSDLSAPWVHWVTPVPTDIARSLIDGLRNELIVNDTIARQLFPGIQPFGYLEAVQLALDRIRSSDVETIWSDALASSMGDLPPVLLTQEQGVLFERRHLRIDAPPDAVYKVFSGVGGRRGWPAFNWLWELRGLLDHMIGGVGMRRGRRHPDEVREGEALDFWRVEQVRPGRSILLRAEMKMPGRGWLAFEATPIDGSQTKSVQTEFVQTAYFAPKGLSGLLYWYGLYPLHGVIFSRMIRNLARSVPNTAGSNSIRR